MDLNSSSEIPTWGGWKPRSSSICNRLSLRKIRVSAATDLHQCSIHPPQTVGLFGVLLVVIHATTVRPYTRVSGSVVETAHDGTPRRKSSIFGTIMAKRRKQTDAIEVAVVTKPDAQTVRSLLQGDRPVVFEGMIDDWKARSWTPQTFHDVCSGN